MFAFGSPLMTDLKQAAQRLIELDGERVITGRDDEALQMAKDYLAKCEEVERLRSAIGDKGGTEHAPTQWAYDQACAAIEKHKAEVERLRKALERLASSNAFHVPKVMSEEERQRITFALQALGDTDE
jgi:hypothetical protein